MRSVFLKAEWRKLLMINYEVDPGLLRTYLPQHTETDLFNGKCYVSLVGFMFMNTRVKGIKVPFHVNFEEVNLRFYVRHNDGFSWKRGVVFIKEIVPKPMLAFTANLIFKEHYVTAPMRHHFNQAPDSLEVEYAWGKNTKDLIRAIVDKQPVYPENDSEEAFITEHYWGYTRSGNNTMEYQVEHPQWKLYPVNNYEVSVDFQENYGSSFGSLGRTKPSSVFVAEGSEITVRSARVIPGSSY